MKPFQDYLSLLGDITKTLEKLTETAQRKVLAVAQDDLAALNETLKVEQALALSLRGYEQRRIPLLAALGLKNLALSALPDQCPEELRLTAKKTVESLQRHYQLYTGAAEAARDMLESNLHQIEKMLAGSDANFIPGPGYAPPAPTIQPPEPLRSDFRA